MCTVTIIPKGGNDFILTSNRDEAPNRVALAPDFYTIHHSKMLFPKDKKAGGTWIGLSDKNRLICLLNGGFEPHKRKESYRISRGIVLTDLLASEKIDVAIDEYNLIGVEPFTLVIADWNSTLKFYEFVWDGEVKHFSDLPLEPRIWSSSPLYTKEMKQERYRWFEELKKGKKLSAERVLEFHKNTQSNNTEYGVIIDRGFVKTTSVTQVEKKKDVVSMRFENLLEPHITETTF